MSGSLRYDWQQCALVQQTFCKGRQVFEYGLLGDCRAISKGSNNGPRGRHGFDRYSFYEWSADAWSY